MRDERRDDGIDELIATAARAMTAGEPTRTLRTGVRDRITRSRSVWPFVPALAGAAVLVAAVIVGRALLGPPGERDNVRPTTSAVTKPVQPLIEQPDGARTARATGTDQEIQTLRRQPVARVRPPLENEEPVIPPLTIEPLSTTQIAVGTGSGVMPIEIEPLQIEPLQGSGQ